MISTALQVTTRVDGQDGVSLSSLLDRVKGVIKAGLNESVWVRAELRKVSAAKSGHFYLELEERDERGQTVAKSEWRIWANRAARWRDILHDPF